jgi:Short C-terminal domain/Phospholipase_D-nuclease N-terminal
MVPTVPFADISFGDLLLLIAEFFLFVIWIWILFTIITDLFRDHELSGWWKAVWIVFLIFIPFLAAFVYLVARGSGMRDRTIKAQAEAKRSFDDYVRTTAASSPADELAKLHDLRVKGVLSDAEYENAKAKVL